LSQYTLVWRGLDAPRMEIAHVDLVGNELHAHGTQVGAGYELRYTVEGARLDAELVGGPRVSLELDGADFFDLGFSPLFNSLPVLRDGLLDGAEPHDYRMRWLAVPELTVEISEQRYEPLEGRRIRFVAGSFEADIQLDEDGFVLTYSGLAERVSR
jgi:hypothetical protein